MAKTYLGSGVAYDATESATYPKGRMKNDTTETAKDGTPLFKDTLDDSYQARMELLRRAGIIPNEALESKAESQVADAVQFMQPVAIMKVGYDGAAYAVLNIKALDGWSATWATSTWQSTIKQAKMALGILKDSVAYTGDLLVSVCIAANEYSVDGPITVSASHGTKNTAGFFDGSIDICAPYSATATQDQVQQTDLIITVYKAD